MLSDRTKTREKFLRIFKSEPIITKILYCLALVQPYDSKINHYNYVFMLFPFYFLKRVIRNLRRRNGSRN